MAKTIAEDQLRDHQVLMVHVSGPDNANRMYLIHGRAPVELTASKGTTERNRYSFFVGPKLSHGNFHRAIAGVSITDFRLGCKEGADPRDMDWRWTVTEMDAAWDDESERVKVRIELEVQAAKNTTAQLLEVAYQVSILAQE
jgi:hypothetical protein